VTDQPSLTLKLEVLCSCGPNTAFSGGLPPTGFQQSDHLPCGRLRIGSQSRRSCQPINGRGRIAARQ